MANRRLPAAWQLAALLLLPLLLAAPRAAAQGSGSSSNSNSTGSSNVDMTAAVNAATAENLASGRARAAANTSFTVPPPPPPGWERARASWYGTPKPFVDTFSPSRGGGESAFGILEWGGCGYTNADGSMPFPRDAVTSFADTNPDFPGSCGRCYEVRCVNGPVLGRNDQAVPAEYWYYFPKYGSAPDDMGRSFPGNPAYKDDYVFVTCWDPSKSVRVHVVDICPCWYEPKGEPPRAQASCCYTNSTNPKSGQREMDLSFWVYEQLAHPMYSEMMLDIRPVDCGSGAALPMSPGYINRDTLYDDMVTTGWSWFPYITPTHNFNVTAPGWGYGGSAAACAEVGPGGGMTWWCRGCNRPGYQPFASASSVSFWVRDRYHPGTAPPLKMMIAQQEDDTYCPGEAYLTSLTPSARGEDGWLQFTLPFDSTFNCGDKKSTRDKISFQSVGGANTWFCLDELKVAQGGSSSSSSTTKK
ncbi:hypothetical protein CHLRE_11g467656v5 [Chlamydomonas reinhardtii]|uniref:Expansin-like EG45 domain-containing protein n=1 Tax=Chlamydomonas reinhardtii TaxID=3055 RepID=A0A2K3D7K8_CHLRE|nr:uncharacterized protein CHLRE_11g467656v5 [Chlamydomonas reinhardtii]PNW76515.1 hypothetical protein CHLRE_11g467656v5 [Chlamydomonas reinhardtii]